MPVIRAWIPAIHDKPFLKLYGRRLNDHLAAVQMQADGYDVSPAMVAGRRKQLGLPTHRNDAPHQPDRPFKSKADPLAIAQGLVDGFDRETMTRHGRPIRLDEVMRITNRKLKANSLPQIDSNPNWTV